MVVQKKGVPRVQKGAPGFGCFPPSGRGGGEEKFDLATGLLGPEREEDRVGSRLGRVEKWRLVRMEYRRSGGAPGELIRLCLTA